jgi:hypothetical protein
MFIRIRLRPKPHDVPLGDHMRRDIGLLPLGPPNPRLWPNRPERLPSKP